METISTTETSTEATEHVGAAPTGLAVLGIDTPFLAAQVVNFFVLFFLLRWLLYRPILAVLNKRRSTIEDSLAHAAAAEAAATTAAAQTKQQLDAAREQAKQIVEDARAQAVTVATQLAEQAASEATELLERTRTQLEQEKTAVLATAERQLSELVLLATEKVVAGHQLHLNENDVRDAIALVKVARG